jgi:hypothetical protein
MPAPPLAKHRWMDRITAGLLAASLGVALGAATPAFLRAAGVEIPVAASPSAAPLALPRRPPEILAHEGLPDMPFDGDDDDVPLFSDPSPGPLGPGGLRDASDPWSQVGLARGPVALHEHPGGATKIVGEVGAGELVTIVRFAGEWALVVHAGAGALVSGWAKRSEIAVR